MSQEEIYQALRNAHAAGDIKAATALANYIQSTSQQPAPAPVAATPRPREDNLLGKVVGTVLETPLTLATGAVAPVLAGATGLAMAGYSKLAGDADPNFNRADTTGNNFADLISRFTYHPSTQTSRNQLAAIANAASDLKLDGLMGMPILEGLQLMPKVATATNALTVPLRAAPAAAVGATKKVMNAFTDNSATMAGVGSARTADELRRMASAQNLRVPMKLTKAQATRDFNDQRFERETAKLPEGELLRNRFEDQNEQMLQNFNALGESTGANSASLRQVGESVDTALRDQITNQRKDIRSAYNDARAKGHMDEPLDIERLRNYLESNRPASLNAPVLSAAESGLKKIDPAQSNKVSINDLEELRMMTSRLAEPGTPNQVYGKEIIDMIDGLTRGRGGPLYKEARAKYEAFARVFTDKDAVDKITRLKPGTTDRAVAMEDVFDHSVLKGSLDDLRAVHDALNASGSQGAQAWRELQGQTINHIKNEITKNVARDARGNEIVSPAALDKVIKNLDADGKLEFVFGKKAAADLRELNDIAKDVYTSPPGAVNSSNTAGVLLGLLDTAVSGLSGMPLPIATTANYARKSIKSRRLKKKIENALNP